MEEVELQSCPNCGGEIEGVAIFFEEEIKPSTLRRITGDLASDRQLLPTIQTLSSCERFACARDPDPRVIFHSALLVGGRTV